MWLSGAHGTDHGFIYLACSRQRRAEILSVIMRMGTDQLNPRNVAETSGIKEPCYDQVG